MTSREQLDKFLFYFYYQEKAVLFDDIKKNERLLKIAGGSDDLQRIVVKIKDDKYVHMYSAYPELPDGSKDMKNGLFMYFTITFDGKLFYENGGYVREANRQRISDIPKNYWWAIAIFTFIVGLFADVLQEWLKQKILPEANQPKLESPKPADTSQSRKAGP